MKLLVLNGVSEYPIDLFHAFLCILINLIIFLLVIRLELIVL